MTYQQIADALGITKMAVLQIERKALKKMRKRLRKLGITKATAKFEPEKERRQGGFNKKIS